VDNSSELRASYKEVGDRTWLAEDFLTTNLASSRNLFTPESLIERRPRPKQLEVFALLSGLPFRTAVINALVQVQREISLRIPETLRYWVLPENFGVEYCVFKWPTDSWNADWLDIIKTELDQIRQQPFEFSIRGVQVNADGCVVARGFDGGVLSRMRTHLRSKLPFLPAKQSQWAHVPLGRILEPVGVERFKDLATFIHAIEDELVVTSQLDSMKLVHESCWYMEEKVVLANYNFAVAPQRN
jgi:hypothetical protein